MTLDLPAVMTTHQQLIHLRTAASLMATTTTTSTSNEINTLYQTQADIDTNIRLFWDDFPCPPPWRPSILTEVNISKLGPRIGESVKKFLFGKCQLNSVFPAVNPDDEDWGENGFGFDPDFHGPDSIGGDRRPTSSSSEHSGCDKTCQLAIGCSGVFVAIVIVAFAIICFTRSRRSHKMPSTRPSRQQLQMSTSTSDPVNWAEFSNAQVQFDDDMIYPPFRHRDLPSPPSQCHHPSCDPKWTHPNGLSFHPLTRVSPASTTYCTRGYTAVYEKIDDEDDEYDDRPPCNHSRPFRPGERTGPIPPIGYRPSNGVPFIPESHANAVRYRQEETGFNGENNLPVSILPRYFELQNTCPNHTTTSSPGFEDQAATTNNTNRDNDSTLTHRNNSCCNNSFQLPSAFSNSPDGNMACNQLCATCVANVVPSSELSCLNNHRQNETVPNVSRAFNIIPISSTANGVSTHSHTTHIPGYFPPNTSSFRQFPHNSDLPPPLIDSVAGNNNPPPYSEQGCDLQHRNTSGAQCGNPTGGHCSDPLYENDNNDGRSPFTDLTGIQHTKHSTGSYRRHCHMTENASSIGSPCREWCPSCQQVPLLQGNTIPHESHSACSMWQNSSNIPLQNATLLHRTCSFDNGVSDNENDDIADNTVSDVKEQVENSNRGAEGYLPHTQERNTNESEVTDDKEVEEICQKEERCRQQDCCSDAPDEMPKPVLSLHSYYFNKPS